MSHHVHTCYRTCKWIGFKQIGRIPDHPNIVTRLDQTGPFAGPSGTPEPSPMIFAGLWLTCPLCGGVPKIGLPPNHPVYQSHGMFNYKPTILGISHFRKPPYWIIRPGGPGIPAELQVADLQKALAEQLSGGLGSPSRRISSSPYANPSREKQGKAETMVRGQKINQQRTVICVNEARDTV